MERPNRILFVRNISVCPLLLEGAPRPEEDTIRQR
jgi:hypothetical protein